MEVLERANWLSMGLTAGSVNALDFVPAAEKCFLTSLLCFLVKVSSSYNHY